MTGLPAFETVARLRPVDPLAPDLVELALDEPGDASRTPCPQPAPSATIEATLGASDGPVRLAWISGTDTLALEYAEGRAALVVDAGGRRTRHVPRRGRSGGTTPVQRLALTLTGTHLTALVHQDGEWRARARVDLGTRVAVHDERWLAGLEAAHQGPVGTLRAGAFGQLGLRDPRLVSHADGRPYLLGDELLLTATSAGPGFFDTAHTSVWSLHPATLALRHRADLFFRRPDRAGVYADHATHLLRDPADAGWLVATSTWGDFERRGPGMRVRVTLAHSTADLLQGRHVLDTKALDLPTDGLGSVGVWDPHLVLSRTGAAGAAAEWLVGYVSARRFFDFHPVVATGPRLDALRLRAAATGRRATEGTTITRIDGRWCVLASDGRDNPREHRAGYPVFDLDLAPLGRIDAPYPSNIPWPTLAPVEDGWLLIGFDGTPCGGRMLGYGTHGDLVIARSTV